MDKYRRYYGIVIFLVVAFALIYGSYNILSKKFDDYNSIIKQISSKEDILKNKEKSKAIIENKKKQVKDSIASSQKKIYAPSETDLGNETLFFTLYNDVIEMIHANNVKIKSMNYEHNPADDNFVEAGKDLYFVCDVNVELVSDYTSLGKLLQDFYQYPYYIRISQLNVKPYPKNKKILITDLKIRLYSRTEPNENS